MVVIVLSTITLFNKTRADNSRWDSEQADAKQGNDRADNFPHSSDRVDIAISYGGERGDGPPHAGEGILKYLRLCGVFNAVHQKGRNHNQKKNNGHRRNQLTGFFLYDVHDAKEGISIAG